jgi:predicted unusual protein kinase regulating ubiquinone biosynthesis (AarF/ABC1/UbiB family)
MQTFRESFGKDISEYFESFDATPIASGTVGQVARRRGTVP